MNSSDSVFDTPVFTVFSRIGDMMILSLLWLLCCLPVVTIGASTAALQYTCLKFARGDSVKTVKTFFEGFRLHFLRATAAMLFVAVALAFLCGEYIAIAGKLIPAPDWCYVIFSIPSFVLLMMLSYVFPLIAFYKGSLWQTIFNAFRLTVRSIFTSITITALAWSPVIWILEDFNSFMMFCMVWTFLGFGAVGYINAHLTYRVFKKHMGPSDFPDPEAQLPETATPKEPVC